MSSPITIDNIVSEMRGLVKPGETLNHTYELLNGLADRIEAALKREVGNGTKMCEALKCIDSIAKYLEAGTIRDVQHAYRNIQDRVRIALATPPRNCDKYATVDEAMDYFADEALIEEWNALKAGKERDLLAEELFVFIKWLYALATKKEGEEK